MRVQRFMQACALAVLLAPAVVRASGYAIYEQGAAALGMAGAYVASAHDATAQFYNPAAMTRLEGKQLSVGASWLSKLTSFSGVAPYPGFGVTEKMKTGNFFPPNVYFTSHLNEKWAWGVGINAPFGLGVEWEDPSTFTGRTIVTKADLRGFNGSASLAFAPNAKWSVAAGPSVMYANVELNNIQTVPSTGGAQVNVAHAKLKSDYKPGYGFHLAALVTPNEQWRIGATYRSEVKVKIDDGDASFTQIPTGDPSFDGVVAAGLPPGQPVTTELVFPGMLSGGVAWNLRPDWTTEVDVLWTQWSAFDKLSLRFPKDPSLNQDLVENYDDQIQIRAGAEHRLATWMYRFGYYYDHSPAPSESVTPLLPDANRHGVTVGAGMTRGQWTLDAYNLFLFVENRSTEGRERNGYNGTYKTYVNALGAAVAYHW
jgi:long-chain fatty acid transport protein